jgi:hypothetical protein
MEPVPKLSPCYETGLFLAKCKKTGKNTFFFTQNKANPVPSALYKV